MNMLPKKLILVLGIWLVVVPTATAQTAATTRSLSTATQVSPSGGGPSPVTIKADFLRQRQAIIQRQLRQVIRCIENAQINLRDVEGNINRVKSTDLLICTRRLTQLRAALASLGQQASALQVEAAQVERLARTLEQQIPGQ